MVATHHNQFVNKILQTYIFICFTFLSLGQIDDWFELLWQIFLSNNVSFDLFLSTDEKNPLLTVMFHIRGQIKGVGGMANLKFVVCEISIIYC